MASPAPAPPAPPPADAGPRSLDHHGPGSGLDAQPLELEHRRAWRGALAAQHRFYARDELAGRERLDDVVVGAAAQPDDPVGLAAAGGEQDHPRRRGLLAQAAHHLEAVEAGQHDVEHDKVRRALGAERERVGAVAGDTCAVAGALEVARHDLADGGLVVDDQHRRARLGLCGGWHRYSDHGTAARGPSVEGVVVDPLTSASALNRT